ncbi:ROK family protein [Bacillus litorisediminis]|uniref:ROK family protein n=1 Tax=Bacillus litorisediminis TaxID=2922713 RepID=UPI001FAED002|nr:ROK family protein [Bacillus litorisediminis]
MKAAIGIDIGGTKIAIGVVDENGKILSDTQFPTEVELGPDNAMKQIISHVSEMREKHKEIAGIGIGCPGPIDTKKGIVVNPPNLKTWHDYPVVQEIESAFQMPVRLLNDADAAALGEYFFTYRHTYLHVLYLTVSTGIGGGIIINGRLYEGASSGAGEIGHSVIEPNGPLCGCGKRGCLEALASGTALTRIWKQRLANAGSPIEPTWGGKELFAQAESGDSLANEVIEESSEYIALGLSQTIQTLNPELLILGGGVVIGQPEFYKKIRKKLSFYLLNPHKQALQIERASHGAMAGVKGAAASILENS